MKNRKDADEFSSKVWESVERNAAHVKTWPEWKRQGSGLLRLRAAPESTQPLPTKGAARTEQKG